MPRPVVGPVRRRAPLAAELAPAIETELRHRVWPNTRSWSNLLTADLAPAELRAAALGPDAAMRGAAELVIRSVQDDPATHLAVRPV